MGGAPARVTVLQVLLLLQPHHCVALDNGRALLPPLGALLVVHSHTHPSVPLFPWSPVPRHFTYGPNLPGWSSWNMYAESVNETHVRDSATALVS
eukprot:COSAG05_NODE_12704_length_458_cov_0.543175_1_plen_94_part_10